MSYTLDFDIKPLNEEEYSAAPEAVRRVYIHVLENIPMSLSVMKATIKKHPEYFILKKKTVEVKKTFGQNVKRLFALRGAKESLKKKTVSGDTHGGEKKMIPVTGTVKERPGTIQIEGHITSAEAAAQLIKLGEALKKEEKK